MSNIVQNRRVTAVILTVISAAAWWECPLLTLVMSAAAVAFSAMFFEKSFKKLILICISIISACLSIANLDLHIGIKLLEFFR